MVAPVYFTGSIASTQDLFTISEPLPNIFPNHIANVSKASTAVVTTSVAPTVSTTGTVGSIAGSGPYTAVITNMSSTAGLLTGQAITATAGTGNLGVGTTFVNSIIGSTSIGITSTATQNAGTITNIKTPAPITTTGLVDGDAILITGVSGMTQLATAGENDTNLFYANVTSSTTFELYSDSELSTGVNSSGFSNAVANTGSYQTFTVSQNNTVASPTNVVFDTEVASSGTDITLDTDTGIITFAEGNEYSISAVVNTTRPLPPVSTAGYQWYDLTADEAIGPFTKFGETCTAVVNSGVETEVVLKVYSDSSTFEYPNQLVNASFIAEVFVPV